MALSCDNIWILNPDDEYDSANENDSNHNYDNNDDDITIKMMI